MTTPKRPYNKEQAIEAFQDWLITDCNVWVSLLIGTVLMLIPMIMLALILLHFWPNGIGG